MKHVGSAERQLVSAEEIDHAKTSDFCKVAPCMK